MDSNYLTYIFIYAHFLLPFSIAIYLVEEYNDLYEWFVILGVIYILIYMLWGISTSKLPSTFMLTNTAGMYHGKLLFLAIYIFGGTLTYFFPDPRYSAIIRKMPERRLAFTYGIIGNLIVYGWWGPGIMEVAIWILLFTFILLTACIMYKQIQVIRKLREQKIKSTISKTRIIMTNCILRFVASFISFFGLTFCGLVRGYLLFAA